MKSIIPPKGRARLYSHLVLRARIGIERKEFCSRSTDYLCVNIPIRNYLPEQVMDAFIRASEDKLIKDV